MATIVYCDRVRHVVAESRMTIHDLLEGHKRRNITGALPDFVYVTLDSDGSQVALRASAITSFQACPGDGI